MLNRVMKICFVLTMFLFSHVAIASDIGFTVLGVIASSKGKAGVALLKNKKTNKVSAYREGSIVKKNLKIIRIYRKNVDFDQNGKTLSMKVGDDEASYKNSPQPSNSAPVASGLVASNGFQKVGSTLTVNRELKDELVNNNLNKILMQAAAVPHMKEGRLVGFKLLEIDSGSIYEVAGFQNGDVITHINEQPINDAGLAIRALRSLKTAANASFNYLRQNQPHELIIKIN